MRPDYSSDAVAAGALSVARAVPASLASGSRNGCAEAGLRADDIAGCSAGAVSGVGAVVASLPGEGARGAVAGVCAGAGL